VNQQSAKDGYRSYLQAYASHSLRSVFNVNELDLVKVAKSFGFNTPPRVDMQLGSSMKMDKKQGARRAYGERSDFVGGSICLARAFWWYSGRFEKWYFYMLIRSDDFVDNLLFPC
jgi:hypothetical protein